MPQFVSETNGNVPRSTRSADIVLTRRRGDGGEALGRLARISRANFMVASAIAACPSAVGWKAHCRRSS